jgi:hypothetical protein
VVLQATEDDLVRRRREENEALYDIAKGMQFSAGARILGLENDGTGKKITAIDPNTLDPDEAARWFVESTKAIRLSMGLPSDFQKGNVQITLATLSTILNAVIDIAEKHMTPAAHEATSRSARACSSSSRSTTSASRSRDSSTSPRWPTRCCSARSP